MKFLLKTRCGCMREMEGFVPIPREITVPLKTPPDLLYKIGDGSQYPIAIEVRKFTLFGSYAPQDGEGRGYVYEEVK